MADRNSQVNNLENFEKFTKIWKLTDNIGKIVQQNKVQVKELKRVQKDLIKVRTHDAFLLSQKIKKRIDYKQQRIKHTQTLVRKLIIDVFDQDSEQEEIDNIKKEY